ncbi:Os01g0517300 [Oryza sativa Japonica Group]|uniref:Os01g0517300 protein n=1 Tax=Oryza sativa subsp. japonica TaxID=39947 RepID=A0A0P0V3C0_ORYSJ|nr:Os01g0517300 [Oryza sativa Japonica Group]
MATMDSAVPQVQILPQYTPSRDGVGLAQETCSSGAIPAPLARSPKSGATEPAPPHAPPQPRWTRWWTGGVTRPPWTLRPMLGGNDAAMLRISVASGGDVW